MNRLAVVVRTEDFSLFRILSSSLLSAHSAPNSGHGQGGRDDTVNTRCTAVPVANTASYGNTPVS